MGYSTQSIPFFTLDITLRPHTATNAKWLNRKVSLQSFCKGQPMYLEQIQETGEYIARLQDGTFMQGPSI